MKNISIDGDISIGSQFHDSTLICIEMGDTFTRLGFRLVDNTTASCKLIGVEQFLCNGLRKGNIVLEAAVIRGKSLDPNISKKLFDSPQSNNQKLNQYLDLIDRKLIGGELNLFLLSPAYGGEIISLCKEIIFS